LGLYGRDVRVAVVTARPALDIAINQWARGFRATNVDDLRTLLRLVADGAVVLVDLDDDARRHVLSVLRDHGVDDPVVVMTASGGVPTDTSGSTGETAQDADPAEDHLHNTVLVSRTAPMQEVADALAAAHSRDLTRVHGHRQGEGGGQPAAPDGALETGTEAAPAREGAWSKWWRMLTAVPDPAGGNGERAEGLDHTEVRTSEGSREADEDAPAEAGTEPVVGSAVGTDEETVAAPDTGAIVEPTEETPAGADEVVESGREAVEERDEETPAGSVVESAGTTVVGSGEETPAEAGGGAVAESGDETPAEAGGGAAAESGDETPAERETEEAAESRDGTVAESVATSGEETAVDAGRGTVAESDDPGDAVELEVLLEGDHHEAAAGRRHVLDALRSDAVRRAAAAGAGVTETTDAPPREPDPGEGDRRREPLVLTDAAACAWVLLDELAPSYLDGAAAVLLRGSGNTFATVAGSGILPEEGITRVPFDHELVRALLQRDGVPVLASTERAGAALVDVPLSGWPWLLAVLLPGGDGPAGMLLVGRPLPFAAEEVERLVRVVRAVPNLLERAAVVRHPAAEATRAYVAALAASRVARTQGGQQTEAAARVAGAESVPIADQVGGGGTIGTDGEHTTGSAHAEPASEVAEVTDDPDDGASTATTGGDGERAPDQASDGETDPEQGAGVGRAVHGWAQRLAERLRATGAAARTEPEAPSAPRRSLQPGVTSEAASASWALLDGVLPFVEDGGAVVALRGSGGWYVPVAATRVQALVGAEVVPVAHPLVARLTATGRVMGAAGFGTDARAAGRETRGLGVAGSATTADEPDDLAVGAGWLAGVPLRERPSLLVAAIGATEAPDGLVIIGRTRAATDDELAKLATVVEEAATGPSMPVLRS
jgi:hypothetical protein